MARSLFDLANGLESRAKLLPALASNLAKNTARVIIKELATKTPVDTSKAISNWIVTIGQPSTNEIEAHKEGSKGSTYRFSATETEMLAQVALLKKLPGQSIFITNNADYIRELNDGSSAQAPAGFVEAAVSVGRNSIKATRKNI